MASKPTGSASWVHQQRNDHFVNQAKKLGYRSRASFKLLEIAEQYQLFRHARSVLDLGAAPGSWSQVAMQLNAQSNASNHPSHPKTTVIAIDLLPMMTIPGVQFFLGDACEEAMQQKVMEALQHATGVATVDVLLSDMAPNISGVRSTDDARFETLGEWTIDYANRFLAERGNLLMKFFHGASFDTIRKELQQRFQTVKVIKPEASRAHSKEVFLLALGFGR